MLEIDNPVVANCLIDQQEIETVLLIPTNDEAYRTLDQQSKVSDFCRRTRLQNVESIKFISIMTIEPCLYRPCSTILWIIRIDFWIRKMI